MPGRQCRVSGETCRACESPAGGRARIVPQGDEPRKARTAKPRRGKVGRKVDARCPERSKRERRQCPRGLRKAQKPATGRGWKLQSGRIAWCRRWRTASKEDVGTV